MRSHLIVLLAPSFNQYLGFQQCREHLPVNELIPQLPALNNSVYPCLNAPKGSTSGFPAADIQAKPSSSGVTFSRICLVEGVLQIGVFVAKLAKHSTPKCLVGNGYTALGSVGDTINRLKLGRGFANHR